MYFKKLKTIIKAKISQSNSCCISKKLKTIIKAKISQSESWCI